MVLWVNHPKGLGGLPVGFWAQHSDGFSDASVLGLRRLGINLAKMTSPHSKLRVEGQDSWNLCGNIDMRG